MSGTADCEVRDEWFLEQDVNAWSSLTYGVAGVVLAVQVVRHRLPTTVYALAAVVAAEGAGSVLFHGSAGDLSQFLHDVALIGALGFIAGWHAGRLVGTADRGSIIGLVVGLVTASVLWTVAPGATNATVAVAVVVIVTTSAAARRRGLAGVWSPAVLVLGVVAVAMWAFGTPDSALCDTDSLFQPHALWHALTAVLALAWVDSAYAAADPEHAPRMFRRFTDRTFGMLARGLVLGFHRSVDVAWRERFPSDRPVLVVANHGNGFVDPVVVAAVLGRLPRFLAKAALWKAVIARPFLGLAGVLPVYRRGTATASATTPRCSRHATGSWRRVRLWRSSPREPRVTAPVSIGSSRVRRESRSVPFRSLPTSSSFRSAWRTRARSKRVAV